MIVTIKYIIITVILFIMFVPFAYGDIRLNEVLIEPDQSVELINTSTEEVDLSSWYIDDSGGSTYYTIAQNTVIQPGSCLVFSANFNLNKVSSDTIRLFNNKAPPTSNLSVLIDNFYYIKSPGIGISYIRVPDANGDWSTGSASLNYFNSIEETCLATVITSITSPTPTPSLTINGEENNSIEIDNVYISEVMVAPNTGENEWVEIYNDNAYKVNLKDWFIDDIAAGGSAQKKFSLIISKYGYSTIEINSSMFNNSGDSIRLLNPENNLIDSFYYDFSEKGKTFGRIDFLNSEYCLNNPTKGQVNDSCLDKNTNNENQNKNPTSTTNPSTLEVYIPKVTENKNIKVQPINYVESQMTTSSNILGASTISYNSNKQKNNHTIQSLTLLSTSYSLLTLFSISLKIIRGI
ncbi:MAG: lamin tail domain-containing protein [bacterium]